MPNSKTLLNIDYEAAPHGVYLRTHGRWVCVDKCLPLGQAKETAAATFKKCGLPTEVRTEDGSVVDRIEP